jgi:KaiC/GvpD/RAD55 family RecA-like ATPase
MAFTKRITLLQDFAESAKRREAEWGRTERFRTGVDSLDDYLGGGYGRSRGSEIVVLFGPTGVGKSTIGLNLLREPILSGQRVGLLTLEDEGEDVYIRLKDIVGSENLTSDALQDRVHMMNPEDMVQSWKLSELLELIHEWFTAPERNLDVILLDHLQFAFENAEAIKGENEYIAQRAFMQKLNQLLKQVSEPNGKTIILISHVSKAPQAKGLQKIVGSSSIAAAGTKVIEVDRDEAYEGRLALTLHKSRHTRQPFGSAYVRMNGMRMEAA